MTIKRMKAEGELYRQKQAKSGYWQNELNSLGIHSRRKENHSDREELETLADIIKQAMFLDYKIAYTEKGDMYKEEANSSAMVG